MDKKTPRALLKLDIGGWKLTVERRREADASWLSMKHLSSIFIHLNPAQAGRQCLTVSLTGAVSSKIVTEERKG